MGVRNMRNKKNLLMGIGGLGLFLIVIFSTIWINVAEAQERVIWEYKIENITLVGDNTKNDDRLNEIGKDGWELVSINSFANESPYVMPRFQFVFKRPKNGTK